MGDDKSDKGSLTTTNSSLCPLSLHHSDHPGLILVSKLLEGENYGTWSRSMRISLSAKNKLGFINGTIKAPAKMDPKFDLWQRCNDMVLSWILNSIHPDLAASVIYTDTATEVWNDLKVRFSQGNYTKIYQIQHDIVENRQGQQSVSTYYTKMKALWDELASCHESLTCSCGGLKQVHDREEKERVMQFLMGLNDSYAAIRGQILLMNPSPDTRQTHALILQQERQTEVAARRDHGTHHVMNAQTSRTPTTQGFSSTKPKLHCSHCNGDGHTIERCYFLIGFPPGHKFHGKNVKPKGRKPTAHNTQAEVTEPVKANEGPIFTTDEYNQLMALLRKGNDNTQPLANATGRGYEEDDWPGQAT